MVRVNYSPLVPGLDPKQQIGFHAEVVDRAEVLKLRTIRQAPATPLPAQQEMIELCMHRYKRIPNLRIGKYRTVDHEVLTEQQLIRIIDMTIEAYEGNGTFLGELTINVARRGTPSDSWNCGELARDATAKSIRKTRSPAIANS